MSQAEPLSIESRTATRSNTRILHLDGPLTLHTLFQFQDAIRSDPPTVTILDLSGVPYMDSAGMGAILNFYVSSQKSGRKLIISGVNYRVVELFKLTRVDTLLTIVPTADDAEKMLL